ncbi:hypothetical protein BVH03_22915 [Pseudomonas sp. PA15(2017)]|uniref:superinfection immunity protein n=1 Tax=Pseudomonas sp. PA15(2017) TaxID=1932111 RepID=UPI000966C21A|nr:superinfection immunity protein [Pseudomonas sp. PA15(2017)]OLU23084.1 hypothetical protein BVH03_22915 [Pseudomonas sp. PA15(2017)]
METGSILFAIGFSLAIYFIPTIIASGRSHPNLVAIFVLNIFGGWTVICWIAALVWAFISPPKVVTPAAPIPVTLSPAVDPVELRIGQLERLARLRAEGALTNEEYETQKRSLLG